MHRCRQCRARSCLFTPNAIAALAFKEVNYGRAVRFNDRFYERKFSRAGSADLVRLVIKGGNFLSPEQVHRASPLPRLGEAGILAAEEWRFISAAFCRIKLSGDKKRGECGC